MEYVDRTDSFMAGIGAEAYRVGGSVRDELLGRRVKDADYMVRGLPLFDLGIALGEHARKFERGSISPLTLRDGRQAGWRVSGRGLGLIEVVLPRTERPIALSPEQALQGGGVRRAFEIVVDHTLALEDDCVRRDFTFNALYKSVHDGQLLDPTQRGLYDLSHKLICTTHESSFRDDPLRTLRALRFVSVLGYELATSTYEQMIQHAEAVTGLSAKGYASGTVFNELCKLLMGDDCARALRLARDTGVLANVLPELAPMLGFEQKSRYHDLTTDEHTFKALETAAHVDAPLRVRLALLFHDSGKPDTAWADKEGRLHYYKPADDHYVVGDFPELFEDHEVVGARIWDEASKRLNVPRDLRNDVRSLILHHMVVVEGRVKPAKVRRARVKLGDSLLRDLYLHRLCDLSGKGKANKEQMERVAVLEQVRQAAVKDDVPAAIGDLAIDGNDLKDMGADGRKIGDVLRAVLDEVVCNPKDQLLTRQWQLARAQELARA